MDDRGWQARGVVERAAVLNYCTCDPLNHKNNKLRARVIAPPPPPRVSRTSRGRAYRHYPLGDGGILYTVDAERAAPALFEPIEIQSRPA